MPSSAPPPSPRDERARTLAVLASRPFDVLIIGGGITGAGVARDAAMRGLAVALVERDDFASGTSSRSSRLVHGGIRYLEHGHLHLVFESSAERRRLLRIAPHLVRPLEFTWPVYAGARVAAWKLAAGLTLYDILALFRNVGTHRRLAPADVLAREPALRRDALIGGASYYDAATDDARLTLANALDATAHGAVVANHAEVRALLFEDGVARGARIVDRLGGAEFAVRARVIVSAAGPWGDEVRRLESPRSGPSVRGTKGVHLAVPRERVGNRGALTLLSPLDERVMFVLPAGGQTIIGTTDTETTTHPDDVRATHADVDYLLRSANAFFPDARLSAADVVAAWAGIRPLIARKVGAEPAAASREHAITRGPSGVLAVSGGKLTTYRAMAEEIVAATFAALGRRAPRSPTASVPLPGGAMTSTGSALAAAAEAARPDVAERLVHTYGTQWRAVWAPATAEPSLAAQIVPDSPYIFAELVHAVRREMAWTLADLLVRRTHVAFETRDHGAAAAAAAVPIVAPLLGWDDAQRRAALVDYDRVVARMFAIDSAP